MKHRLPEPLLAYRQRHTQRPAMAKAIEKEQTAAKG